MHASDLEVLIDFSYAATRIILEAAERLTDDQWTAQPPLRESRSLRHILVHMLDTESGWRENLRAARHDTLPELDPADFPNARVLAIAWREDERVMRAWLATLDDETVNAASYIPQLRLWNCLVHVVNHSTQHRSEAAMILTHFGQSPGDLDFTFYFKGFSED